MQTEETFIFPAYYYIVERNAVKGEWLFKRGSPFYNPTGEKINCNERERYFGLTKPQMATELFRINGGKSGWYLVDMRMRSRKYYYCGDSEHDLKLKLRQLLLDAAR